MRNFGYLGIFQHPAALSETTPVNATQCRGDSKSVTYPPESARGKSPALDRTSLLPNRFSLHKLPSSRSTSTPDFLASRLDTEPTGAASDAGDETGGITGTSPMP